MWNSSSRRRAYQCCVRFRFQPLLLLSLCHGFHLPVTVQEARLQQVRPVLSPLSAKGGSKPDNDKPKGVYVRPSAVIEKGSGFFFPGLEGPRVRLFVGTGLLLATALNHVLSSSVSVFSEGLGVFYSLFVLLQGAIETSKEGRIQTIQRQPHTDDATCTGPKANLTKQWSAAALSHFTTDAQKDKVEWAAASFLSLTAATHMILIQDGRITFWLGVTPNLSDSPDSQAQAATAALTTLHQSKGGRVALPADHPAAQLIPQPTYRRSIILQTINQTSAWMVASNDLLATFTKQDLLWLGQLAAYLQE